MNIAQQYPARTDTNGVTWFRPVKRGKGDAALRMWGWTADLDQAHPDYFAGGDVPRGCQRIEINGRPVLVHLADVNKPVSEEEIAVLTEFAQHLESKGPPPVTELLADGTADTYRRSDFCGFPLPPFPEQVNVDTDGWNRYKLPSPTTGKLTAYTRATTVAGVTPDDYNLVQWKIRMKVDATLECARAYAAVMETEDEGAGADWLTAAKAAAYAEYLQAWEDGKGKPINQAIDKMHDICGGAESREHGGAVHDWIAELDMGKVLLHQIPEQYQVHARAYQDCMKRAGLIAIPEYTERLVLHTSAEETIAGRLDGIAYCVETGEYHVLDRKTSKTLDFSALEFGIQVAGVYAGADLMLKMDRTGWDPMPEVNTELAFIIHVPSDQPERSQVVPIAIPAGQYALNTAIQVRAERRNADKVFFGHSYPIPSAEALRYVEARQRLQDLQSLEDAQEILAEYADVMDDELREFGATCFALIDTDNEENAS